MLGFTSLKNWSPAMFHVTSTRRSSPSMHVDRQFIGGFKYVHIIARHGRFRYNTDHSIDTGLLAARNILGQRHDLNRVNAEQDYHEIKRARPAAARAGTCTP